MYERGRRAAAPQIAHAKNGDVLGEQVSVGQQQGALGVISCDLDLAAVQREQGW
jgi:hypothetical protein